MRPGCRLTFFVSPKKVSKERRPDVHALLRRVRCAAQLGRGLAKLAALKQTRGLIPLALRCSALPTGKAGAGELASALVKSLASVHPTALVLICLKYRAEHPRCEAAAPSE